MDIDNNNWTAMSDSTIAKALGDFIRHNRLEQNKTQMQLATEAGINRTTLSQVENGMNSNLLTFIALIRALKLIPALEIFRIKQQISPLKLAKMEKSKLIRASNKDKGGNKPKSDW